MNPDELKERVENCYFELLTAKHPEQDARFLAEKIIETIDRKKFKCESYRICSRTEDIPELIKWLDSRCCGKLMISFKLEDKTFTVGFNYGH